MTTPPANAAVAVHVVLHEIRQQINATMCMRTGN